MTTVRKARRRFPVSLAQASLGLGLMGASDAKAAMYTYDARNRLIGAQEGRNTLENAFNGAGLRVSKTANGETTRFLYEYDQIVLEEAPDSTYVRNVYGLNMISREFGGDKYFYMYNGHHDVTNVFEGSIQIASYYYDAFGVITEETGQANNPYRYSGYYYDSETKLYDLKARFYDPKIARFLQEDTFHGNPRDALSLNRYSYCRNNPMTYFDPTGHAPSKASRPGEYYQDGDGWWFGIQDGVWSMVKNKGDVPTGYNKNGTPTNPSPGSWLLTGDGWWFVLANGKWMGVSGKGVVPNGFNKDGTLKNTSQVNSSSSSSSSSKTSTSSGSSGGNSAVPTASPALKITTQTVAGHAERELITVKLANVAGQSNYIDMEVGDAIYRLFAGTVTLLTATIAEAAEILGVATEFLAGVSVGGLVVVGFILGGIYYVGYQLTKNHDFSGFATSSYAQHRLGNYSTSRTPGNRVGTDQARLNIAARALTAEAIANAVGGIDDKHKTHILDDKHDWNKLVPDPKDPKNWWKISAIIETVLLIGEKEPYKTVFSNVLEMGNGIVVRVTYQIVGGVINISDAWVIRP